MFPKVVSSSSEKSGENQAVRPAAVTGDSSVFRLRPAGWLGRLVERVAVHAQDLHAQDLHIQDRRLRNLRWCDSAERKLLGDSASPWRNS